MLGPIVGAVAVALALLAIHHIEGRIHPGEIRRALLAFEPATVALALAFAGVSFAAMALYDVLAARRVAPLRIPAGVAMLAGAIGYGFSNALGFHVFIGGPLRYRIYQSVGIDAADVGRIVGLSVLTAWSGMVTVVGLALLLDPVGLPYLHGIASGADRALGAAIVAGVALLLVWLGRGRRQLDLFGWSFPLPGAGQGLLQIAIGSLDFAAAAATLYVLLPADAAPGFSAFLLLYIVATVAAVASHAPGGLGVLEATILLGLGVGARADVVASLLVFRLVYYVIPLAAASALLLGFEAHRARERLSGAAGGAAVLSRRLVPPACAALVFAGGVALLVSGSTPAVVERMRWLEMIIPLPFAEASHLLASLTGLLLVVVARGLYRRIAAARLAATALLAAGAAFSMLKGADWDAALVLVAIAAVLALSRRAFYRGGGLQAMRPDATGVGLLLIVVCAVLAVGLIAYRHVEYRPILWWQFAWHGDASRFLRAMLAIAVAAGALALDALISRPAPVAQDPTRPAPDAVRRILETCADTQPNVALLGDKRFMLAPADDAFLMYAVSGRSWITMGDPVGDEGAAKKLIWRFMEAADRAGARAVFYAVKPAFLPSYLELDLALLKIGEVARVDLSGFSLAGPARSMLRQARSRAAREGLEFSVVPRDAVAGILPQLRGVSDAWLASKHGREKGFSLGRFDDAYLREFDCAVLSREGEIVAFANLWRSGDGEEISIDLMRYRPGISKILMEALFVHLFLYGKEQGYHWFNLGAAPLSGLSEHPLASTWGRVGTFIYRRGDEFYNFSGLRAFKQKFDPVWTPEYLACPGGLSLARVLADVTLLIAGGASGVLRR